MIVDVEDIKAYRNARQLLIIVHQKIIPLLPIEEKYDLCDHMRRSSKSICRSIAEGYSAKDSLKDFRNCLRIAMREASEMVECFKQCQDLNYLKFDVCVWFIDKYSLVLKQITLLRKNWKSYG